MQIFRQDKIELTRSDWKLILGYLAGMSIWLSYRFYVEGYGLMEGGLDILLNIWKVMTAFYALKFLIEYFFLRKSWWIAGFITILIVFVLIGGTSNILGALTAGRQAESALFPINQFIVNGLNSALFEVALLIGFVFSKKSYDQFINNKNLAIENRDNTLKILRSQFSPHFLFNNLNTIDALIDDRPAVAKQYVSHLASLYRYLTQTVDQDIMPLEAELDFIRDYLFLIQVRFGDDYRFDLKVEQSTNDRYLPTGALQTVVENVVKHNAIDDDNQIVTTLVISDEVATISNTKGSSSVVTTTGTGLRNLAKRFELLNATPPVIHNFTNRFEIQLPLLQVEQI